LQLTDAAFKQLSKNCHHLKTLNINRCGVSLSFIALFRKLRIVTWYVVVSFSALTLLVRGASGKASSLLSKNCFSYSQILETKHNAQSLQKRKPDCID